MFCLSERTYELELLLATSRAIVSLQAIVKQQLAAEIARFLGNTTDDAKLWNNLLKLKVYYEDFNYENIEETPSYSVSQNDSFAEG